jgi:hypothetical protein
MVDVPNYLRGVGSISSEGFKNNAPSSGKQVDYLEKGTKVFKPKMDVEQRIRFFPGRNGYVGQQLFVHFNVGPEKKTLGCLSMLSEPCPLCAESRRLYDEGRNTEGSDIKKVSCWLTYILDRNDEAAGPQVYVLSDTPMNQFRELIKDREKGGEPYPVDDIEIGKDLFLIRKEDGRGKRYAPTTFSQMASVSPLSPGDKSDFFKNFDPKLLSKRSTQYFEYVYGTHSLENILKIHSSEEVMKIYGVSAPEMSERERVVDRTEPVYDEAVDEKEEEAPAKEAVPEREPVAAASVQNNMEYLKSRLEKNKSKG